MKNLLLLLVLIIPIASHGQVKKNLFTKLSSYGSESMEGLYEYNYDPSIGATGATYINMLGTLMKVEKNDPLHDDFKVIAESGKTYVYNLPVFLVADDKSGISLTEQGVTGVVGNKEIENIAGNVYSLRDVSFESMGDFCSSPELPEVENSNIIPRSYDNNSDVSNRCIEVYIEVDHDVYQDKGSIDAVVSFVTSMFNEVNILYKEAGINVKLKTIRIWDVPSPYPSSGSSLTFLRKFGEVRKEFDGHIGQLISYKSSGGIAYLSGLCHPATNIRMSFSSISKTFNQWPSYSWNIMVIAHELGHQLGSKHTHACVWNGNNTAIDGCAGGTEGSCPDPGVPQDGGTIMSYCHLKSVGINFNKGFHPQPAQAMRNLIGGAVCVDVCDEDDGGDEYTCELNEVIIKVKPDFFGSELAYKITNSAGGVVLINETMADKNTDTIIDTLCLPDDCYTFTATDSYGDGICCDYGEGLLTISYEDKNLNYLFRSDRIDKTICIGVDGGDCNPIDLSDVGTFGMTQDRGTVKVLDENTIELYGNAWKSVTGNYIITDNTIIEFEIKVDVIGEMHGVGFDENTGISSNRLFKVAGTQAWGIRDFDDGNSMVGKWIKYYIPVGQYYTGEFTNLFFCNDKDRSPQDNKCIIKNVKIYESGDCNSGSLIDLGDFRPE
jgi:hypothetical protein